MDRFISVILKEAESGVSCIKAIRVGSMNKALPVWKKGSRCHISERLTRLMITSTRERWLEEKKYSVHTVQPAIKMMERVRQVVSRRSLEPTGLRVTRKG